MVTTADGYNRASQHTCNLFASRDRGRYTVVRLTQCADLIVFTTVTYSSDRTDHSLGSSIDEELLLADEQETPSFSDRTIPSTFGCQNHGYPGSRKVTTWDRRSMLLSGHGRADPFTNPKDFGSRCCRKSAASSRLSIYDRVAGAYEAFDHIVSGGVAIVRPQSYSRRQDHRDWSRFVHACRRRSALHTYLTR